ncbi:hypothetical protein [Pseudomonas typographi]|uniref:Serine kinase/phosphatase n=1 Tax=Pseudomonas typographi TaxID=2715964 RepID=A0ABR7Z7Q8_9PSED|nr:hypothetical protein [Pseudomonas typographi]MBD1551162.1 hypothetical protein [Pseudomonas typographi]MBD1586344.1 hypothetical protein [Pseudomonas typographi]MBD1601303.1 hypothetical protein [Pseudomonas typographi]
MNSDIKQQGGFENDPDSTDPLDPIEPGVNPADRPGGGSLPDHEGEIPLNPDDESPLPDDDPLSDEDPPSAAM